MTFQKLNNTDRLEFEKYFTRDKKALKLDQEYHSYQKRGMWVQAMQAKAKLDKHKEMLFQKWVHRLSEYAEKVDLNKLDIPNDIKEKMNILYVTAFMACDIVESCVMDMNDSLKKVDDSLSVEMFDGMLKIFKDAKSKLAMFQRNTGYLDNSYWGDKCDDMYTLMQNKAKKLIKYNINL